MTHTTFPLKIVKIVNLGQCRGITAEKVECCCKMTYLMMA
jgi:hypothetical protein